MQDISKHHSFSLDTKATKLLKSNLVFNYGDDITLKISVIEDGQPKDLTNCQVDLVVANQGNNIPIIHKFEEGGIDTLENVFHYKQIIPLKLGDNTIGRYMKGSKTTAPIETNDPSIDINHCVINVSKNKKGGLQYVLRDGPSNTGTFVDNEILGDRERRVIYDGTLFTIGATSIILRAAGTADK